MTDCVVIGGGLAGLSAAVELSAQGAAVTLLEQAPRTGGRCSSYPDEATGDAVDNGQHLLLGAYHHLFRYLERIGTRRHLHSEGGLRLKFHHPAKGFGTFHLPQLPAAGIAGRALSFALGAASFSLLSLRERAGLLRGARAIASSACEASAAGRTVDEWLALIGQG